MFTKILAMVLSIFLLCSTNAEAKHLKKKKKQKEVRIQFMQPQFFPVAKIVRVSCGYVENGGIIFFMVRSTDIEAFTQDISNEAVTELENCIRVNVSTKISTAPSEMLGAEVFHDELICSTQKMFGFPETFTVTTTEITYLHPERVKACMQKLESLQKEPLIKSA